MMPSVNTAKLAGVQAASAKELDAAFDAERGPKQFHGEVGDFLEGRR